MLSTAELDRLAKSTGCEMHDDCLTCPLPECIYDRKRGLVDARTRQRHDRIRQMSECMSKRDVAEQLGITVRTVYRVLEDS